MARPAARRAGRFATAGRLIAFTFLALVLFTGPAWAQAAGQNNINEIINTLTHLLYRIVGPGVMAIGVAQTAYRYLLAGSQEGGRSFSGLIMGGILLSCGGYLINGILTGSF